MTTPEERPGRVAVITGGSGGIGTACARLLVARGYDVIVSARHEGALAAGAASAGARWVAADSTDHASFAAVIDAAGPVDLLVHATGTLDGTFTRRETLERFDAIIRTNLRSAFVVSQAALPVMRAGGRIVFISSSAAHRPQPGRAAYSASKAGLNAFAAALGQEVEQDGIAVHVVTPGPVATAMLESVHFPMMTLAPERVAEAIVWLDQLPPDVVLPELVLAAVHRGPFAGAPYVPEAARARGRTTLPPQ